MSDMTAEIAEANGTPVLVDVDGTVWLDLSSKEGMGTGWTYLSDVSWSWDVHDRLPAIYAPYRPLDAVASKVILNSVTKEKTR